MSSPEERAAIAKALREEAHAVLAETGLFALFERSFGDPSVTGSAGYDLMTWRDIDIHMAVDATRWLEWARFASDIALQLDSVGLALHRATYLNDWVDPHPLGAGLYWGIEFRDHHGHDWKLDLWGWDPFDYAVRQARDFSLRTDLQAADRDLILRLKTEARARDNYYGVRVSVWDIYQFAIARAGESLSALEAWKRTQ
jgi:hypothetical protein